ncbi:MAG: hypothetical protein JSR79_01470, partial [Proteobacteria bacterium]|nr:hypothetical protein [Pseudomonadota bacterium]
MARLPSSTAFRFAAFYSATFTMLIVVMGASVYWAIRTELRYDLDQRVVTERDAVTREAAISGWPRVIADRARREQGDMRYALLDAGGKLVAGRAVTQIPATGWANMKFVKNNGQPDATRAFATRTA